MTSKQFANRLTDVTRSLTETALRQASKEFPSDAALRVHPPQMEPLAADPVPQSRRVPAPPPSPLISARIRHFTQEETRLHWHHHDLPVSRFSACMMLPG